MKVPDWLAHLRRDDRGRPVPYVNRWGLDDDVARFTIEHDPVAGRPGVFYRDDGPPDFLHQSPQRQREVTRLGWCQVCGRPVPWSRRFLVVSSISVESITVDDSMPPRPALALTEPWLDERCAEFAVTRCPGLIRRTRDSDIALLSITSQRQCSLVVSRGYLDGPLEAESRRVEPAMWAKIVVPSRVLAELGTRTVRYADEVPA